MSKSRRTCVYCKRSFKPSSRRAAKKQRTCSEECALGLAVQEALKPEPAKVGRFWGQQAIMRDIKFLNEQRAPWMNHFIQGGRATTLTHHLVHTELARRCLVVSTAG